MFYPQAVGVLFDCRVNIYDTDPIDLEIRTLAASAALDSALACLLLSICVIGEFGDSLSYACFIVDSKRCIECQLLRLFHVT